MDISEIEENDFNLNIARYVQTAKPELPVNVKAELQTLKKLLVKRDEAEAVMMGNLRELGYDS